MSVGQEWDALLDHTVALVRMALTEAGYPNAHVYSEVTGVFIDDVPRDVQERAFDLVNQLCERQGIDRQWKWFDP